MSDEGLCNREATCVDLQYLVNASARGVGLTSQNSIGGTLIQAKSTVDAARVEVPRGTIACRVMRTALDMVFGGAQKRNLPGLRNPFGSSACLTARIASRSPFGSPQTEK